MFLSATKESAFSRHNSFFLIPSINDVLVSRVLLSKPFFLLSQVQCIIALYMEKGQMGVNNYIVFKMEVIFLAFHTIKGTF